MGKEQDIEVNSFDVNVEVPLFSQNIEVNSFDVDVVLDK
jgi:hypothetical protein